MIYIIIAFVIIMLCVFLYYENNALDITEYEVKSENVSDKLLIAHLSDLHSKPFGKVINKLNEVKPDIIVITGDYINDRCKNKDKMLEFGKRLVEVAPVIYITGNHERRLENFEGIMAQLRGIGFKVLLNECCDIRVKGTSVAFLGLDENQADFEDYKARKKGTFVYRDMSPYFRELEKYDGYKILLSHFPENFEAIPEMNYSQYGFDLQLSGHAHGGQFILPFFGPVFSPGQGIRPKYARGSFGERPRLIVSRGLGNAEFPFRLFNHPEINLITLNRKETE
jgi:predicted MPP superfamily phosphohydrolase